MNIRYYAALVIDQITEGRSLDQVMPIYLEKIVDPRDKGLLQALCYGVCRFYTRLDVMASAFLDKPMKAKDSDIHALILVGLYQLSEMRVPAHAAVAETVNAAKLLSKKWAPGLANAVLRAYLRHPTLDFSDDEEAAYAHPYWWISALRQAWPGQWEKMLEANNAHPPFALRAKDREASLSALEAAGHKVMPIKATNTGLVLEEAVPVDELPGFLVGALSVQDGAAQLAASLLPLKRDARVLDACAAPGGKLTHILQNQPHLAEVVAVEKDASRMKSIQENLDRLDLSATLICADAKKTASWWDEQSFDEILLDAPCSASGVVRRHPDIKLLRQAADIAALAKQQLSLLKALWPTLAEGGTLVYATCSVFPQENEGVIKAFLAEEPSAEPWLIEADWGVATGYGRQILTGEQGMDGFYYARLRKKS